MLGITVGSNKSLIGEGKTGVIKGRGLRMVNGVSNVIIQYVQSPSRLFAQKVRWNPR
jgi:pectin lyase